MLDPFNIGVKQLAEHIDNLAFKGRKLWTILESQALSVYSGAGNNQVVWLRLEQLRDAE